MKKHSILCINLGTPDEPSTKAVRRYLKEFLMDKRVIALPYFIRWILVHGIIVPFRSRQSTHNYQTIWQPEGSPLMINTKKLIHKLQKKIGPDVHVTFAMRYGHPSIPNVLKKICKTSELITILPLYPQYASATNGSSIEAVFKTLQSLEAIPSIRIIRDFYNDDSYINALAQSIKPYIDENTHLLLSYHGLPENQLAKLGCQPVCQRACSNTPRMGVPCYRQQSFITSECVARALDLKTTQYTVSFQSRLGKTPWIKPYTDEMLHELSQKGIKHLAIACPSFIADCLETLEEIGIQAEQTWKAIGGETFKLIPCLNDQDIWIDALDEILSR
ncbi:MAG: ferrochelatase [Gammaproteobacteria bacterium]|nr:ferrochelatase [Gammaproteobacteria bacterium]